MGIKFGRTFARTGRSGQAGQGTQGRPMITDVGIMEDTVDMPAQMLVWQIWT